jgi:hypothetical protein
MNGENALESISMYTKCSKKTVIPCGRGLNFGKKREGSTFPAVLLHYCPLRRILAGKVMMDRINVKIPSTAMPIKRNGSKMIQMSG